MLDWARWRHKHNTTARTRGRDFLLGPGAADCAPTPLAGPKAFFDEWPEKADILGSKEKKLDLATENLLHNVLEQPIFLTVILIDSLHMPS